MPLRDHFHPPVTKKIPWDAIHGAWPAMCVRHLNPILPRRFLSGPRIHRGFSLEIDTGYVEDETLNLSVLSPSLVTEADLLRSDEYEVRIIDHERERKLAAVIEFVAPSNKGQPDKRQSFIHKCESLLRKGVSVTLVDIVTENDFNLYTELLNLIGCKDSLFETTRTGIYAVTCRWIDRDRKCYLEAWSHVLQIGQPLPTLPLWLAENFYFPLNLESTYEEVCQLYRLE